MKSLYMTLRAVAQIDVVAILEMKDLSSARANLRVILGARLFKMKNLARTISVRYYSSVNRVKCNQRPEH